MTAPLFVLVLAGFGIAAVSASVGFWVAIRWVRANEKQRMDATRLWFAGPIVYSFLGMNIAYSAGWFPNPPGWFHAALAIFVAGWLYPKRVFNIGPGGLSFGGGTTPNGKDESEAPGSSSAPAPPPASSTASSSPAKDEQRD